VYLQEPTQRPSAKHREGDTQRGIEKSGSPGADDLLKVHPKPQADNRSLQEVPGYVPGLLGVGMMRGEGED
jgi:hypothetical protein